MICYETFPEGITCGNECVCQEEADWKLVHHQSGGSSEMLGSRAGR